MRDTSATCDTLALDEKAVEKQQVSSDNDSVCDSTPHPPAPSALDESTGRSAKQLPPTHPAQKSPDGSHPGSPDGSPDPGPIHVLATFDTHEDLLAAARRTRSWLRLTDEAVHRALLPPLSHVIVRSILKRLDDPTLTLDEARDVIRRLADERERLVDKIEPQERLTQPT